MDDEGLHFLYLMVVNGFGMIDAFIHVADGSVAGPVVFEEAGLVFPHAAGDLTDGLINGGIEQLGGAAGLDSDVIGAKKDDFRKLPLVRLDVEDYLDFDDARIVEPEAFDFFDSIFADRISDFHVAASDSNIEINIDGLHSARGWVRGFLTIRPAWAGRGGRVGKMLKC